MKKNSDLLIEIGTEELPSNQLINLSSSFTKTLSKNMKKYKLIFNKIKKFYTPRRITLILYNIPNNTKEKKIITKGPKKNLQNNDLTTIHNFTKKHNIKINDLKIMTYKKIEYYIHENIIPQNSTIKLLPKIIESSIYEIYIYKKMKWSNIEHPFIRPIKWITSIFNKQKICFEIYNIKSGKKSYGHNLLNNNKNITVFPSTYEKNLEKYGHIIPCHKKRFLIIENYIKKITKTTKIFIEINNTLLNDNVNITEYPKILIGSYPKNLLQIPNELIINIIENQQKCFILKNNKKKIINKFILITNIYKFSENIIKNYQKVIIARLKDIIFLLNEINNISLIKKLENLKNITFHKKLGSLYNKILRIKTISLYFTSTLKYNQNIITKICLLIKNDIPTKIIKDFPDLQGVIGYNLSKKINFNKNISIALKEQNNPKFYKDKLPKSISGTIISLSDKIDTIVGFYNIKIIPTGNKDPYSLKRLSINIIDMLVNNNIKITLINIIIISLKCYKIIKNDTIKKLLFILFLKRWKYFYNNYENKNLKLYNENKTTLYNFIKFTKEINNFSLSKKSKYFFDIEKRIKNFVNKNKIKYNTKINMNLIKTNHEYIILTNIIKIQTLKKNINNEKIKQNTLKYTTLKIKIYLNKIFILTKNKKIKKNRTKITIHINKIISLI